MDGEQRGAAERQELVSLPVGTVQGMMMLMWSIQSAEPTGNPEVYLASFPKTFVIMSGDLINEVELAVTGRVMGADISSSSYTPSPERV